MTYSGDGPETGSENGALVETDCVAEVRGLELTPKLEDKTPKLTHDGAKEGESVQ